MAPSDEHAEVIEALAVRRRALESKLAELMAPPEQNIGVGFGKRVGDGTTEAVERISSTLTARSIDQSIKEIDGVLARVEDGTYGTCEVCGDVISAARLEARPASLRCVSCASKS